MLRISPSPQLSPLGSAPCSSGYNYIDELYGTLQSLFQYFPTTTKISLYGYENLILLLKSLDVCQCFQHSLKIHVWSRAVAYKLTLCSLLTLKLLSSLKFKPKK